MSKTYKHKTRHIFHLEEQGLIKLPSKLKWSYLNKINRHNLDYDIERAKLSSKRDNESKIEMRNQIDELKLIEE